MSQIPKVTPSPCLFFPIIRPRHAIYYNNDSKDGVYAPFVLNCRTEQMYLDDLLIISVFLVKHFLVQTSHLRGFVSCDCKQNIFGFWTVGRTKQDIWRHYLINQTINQDNNQQINQQSLFAAVKCIWNTSILSILPFAFSYDHFNIP